MRWFESIARLREPSLRLTAVVRLELAAALAEPKKLEMPAWADAAVDDATDAP